jgi:hypothetical protein
MIHDGDKYKIVALYEEPDPCDVVFWADLTADIRGGALKIWDDNAKQWVEFAGVATITSVISINVDGYWTIDSVPTTVKAQGPKGESGNSATVNVIATEQIPYNQPAEVINSGTPSDVLLTFKIPQGQPGANGVNGTNGANGTEVQLRVGVDASGVSTDAYIQWKYVTDTNWINLQRILDLKGTNGAEGDSFIYRWVDTTKLQVGVLDNSTGGETWGSTVELKGAKGDKGDGGGSWAKIATSDITYVLDSTASNLYVESTGDSAVKNQTINMTYSGSGTFEHTGNHFIHVFYNFLAPYSTNSVITITDVGTVTLTGSNSGVGDINRDCLLYCSNKEGNKRCFVLAKSTGVTTTF